MSRQSRTRTGLRPSFDGALAGIAVASTAAVVLGALVQVRYGGYQMPLETVWRALFDRAVWTNPDVLATILLGDGHAELLGVYRDTAVLSDATAVVWTQRLPRVVVAVFVGANLAVAGAIFQAITRNELASPYILGVSNGAGMVVLLTLTLFSGLLPVMPLLAALGGAVAFLIVYAIAWKNGTNPVRLVLAGVVVSTVFGSVQRALFFFIDNLGVVMSAQTWLSGSLLGTDWAQVRIALPFTVLSLALAFLVTNELDVLLLGEETAESLGMPVEKVRFGVAGIAILSTAAAIAVAGLIGFVGLIVPHMVRNIVGNNTRDLLAGCVVLGPALLVGADVGARLALDPVQLPVGIITGLVGGPYFLYLMRRTENLGDI